MLTLFSLVTEPVPNHKIYIYLQAYVNKDKSTAEDSVLLGHDTAPLNNRVSSVQRENEVPRRQPDP